jgi:hypothetical protein
LELTFAAPLSPSPPLSLSHPHAHCVPLLSYLTKRLFPPLKNRTPRSDGRGTTVPGKRDGLGFGELVAVEHSDTFVVRGPSLEFKGLGGYSPGNARVPGLFWNQPLSVAFKTSRKRSAKDYVALVREGEDPIKAPMSWVLCRYVDITFL